jgi:hypothetical protein
MVLGHEPFEPVTMGARVYTQDRIPLGWVRDIRRYLFQVEPPRAAAYWLNTDCIRWTAEGVVLLGIDTEDLDGYQIECPDGADVADSPDVGGEH